MKIILLFFVVGSELSPDSHYFLFILRRKLNMASIVHYVSVKSLILIFNVSVFVSVFFKHYGIRFNENQQYIGKYMEWSDYDSGVFFDEVMKPNAQPRVVAKELCRYLKTLSEDEILQRKTASERCITEMGVSFTIYSEGNNIDRDWPFDLIPRPIPADEWRTVEKGLIQRM